MRSSFPESGPPLTRPSADDQARRAQGASPAPIEVIGLRVQFGRSVILDGLSLIVPSGGIVAVTGRPHSGKSALCEAIFGRPKNFTGTVHVWGLDARTELRSIRQRVTWIAGSGVLEPHLTARQNVSLALRLSSASHPGTLAVDRALRESDLPDRAFDRRAESLSPFERWSTSVALARLRPAHIVLFDDPTALFGPSESRRSTLLIRELSAQGLACLITTTDEYFADEVAGVVYAIERGRLSTERVSQRHGNHNGRPGNPGPTSQE